VRILIASLLIVSFGLPVGQTSQTLRDRYGEPDIERFTAAHDIGLTVEYGSDHLACHALIEPPQPLTYTEEHVPLMSSVGVSEILERSRPSP